MTPEQKLKNMGITLPPPKIPSAAYMAVRQSGNLLYISGQSCKKNGKSLYEGKLGQELGIEEGQECARQCAINIIVVLKEYLGELSRINKFIKILGFVNAVDTFIQQPEVINGASQFLEEILGDAGKHARSAVSCNSLPGGIPVEIEAIVEIAYDLNI